VYKVTHARAAIYLDDFAPEGAEEGASSSPRVGSSNDNLEEGEGEDNRDICGDCFLITFGVARKPKILRRERKQGVVFVSQAFGSSRRKSVPRKKKPNFKLTLMLL